MQVRLCICVSEWPFFSNAYLMENERLADVTPAAGGRSVVEDKQQQQQEDDAG